MFKQQQIPTFASQGTQGQQNPLQSQMIGSNNNAFSGQKFQNFMPSNSIFESEYITFHIQPNETKKVEFTEEELQSDPRLRYIQKRQKEILEAKKNKVLREKILNEDDIQNQLKNPILKNINDQINKIWYQTDQILRQINSEEENYLFPVKIETIKADVKKIKADAQNIKSSYVLQQNLNDLGHLCWKTSTQLEQVNIEIQRIEKLFKKENQLSQINKEDIQIDEQQKIQSIDDESFNKLDEKINILSQLFEGFNNNLEQITVSQYLKNQINHHELKNNQDISTQSFKPQTLSSKIKNNKDDSSDFLDFSQQEESFNTIKNLINQRLGDLNEILLDLDISEIDKYCYNNKNKNKTKFVKGRIDFDLDDLDADEENDNYRQSNRLNGNSNDYNLLHFQQMMNRFIKGKNIKLQNPIQISNQFSSIQQQQQKFLNSQSNKRVIQLDLDDNLSDSLEEIQATESIINPIQTQNSFLQCQNSILQMKSCIQKISFVPTDYKIEQSIPFFNKPHQIKKRQNIFTLLKNTSKQSQKESNIYLGESHYYKKFSNKQISHSRLTPLQYEQLTEALKEEKNQSSNTENQKTQKNLINQPSKNLQQQNISNTAGFDTQNPTKQKIQGTNHNNIPLQTQQQTNTINKILTNPNQGKTLQTNQDALKVKKSEIKQVESNSNILSDGEDSEFLDSDEEEQQQPPMINSPPLLQLPVNKTKQPLFGEEITKNQQPKKEETKVVNLFGNLGQIQPSDTENKQKLGGLFQQQAKPQDKKQEFQNLFTKTATDDKKLFSGNPNLQQNHAVQQPQATESKVTQQGQSQQPLMDKQKQQPAQVVQQQQKQNTQTQQNNKLFAAQPPDSPPIQPQIAQLPPDSPTEVKQPSEVSNKAEQTKQAQINQGPSLFQQTDQTKLTQSSKQNEQTKQTESLFGGQNSLPNKPLFPPLTTENKPKQEQISKPQTEQIGGLFGQLSVSSQKNAPASSSTQNTGLFQPKQDGNVEKPKSLIANIQQPNTATEQKIDLSKQSQGGIFGNMPSQSKGLFAPEAKADVKPPAAPTAEADKSAPQQIGFTLKSTAPNASQDVQKTNQATILGQGATEQKGLFGNMTQAPSNNQNIGGGLFGQQNNTNTSNAGLFNFTNKTDNKANTNQLNDEMSEKNDVNKKKKLSTENNQPLISNLNNMNSEFGSLNLGLGNTNPNPTTAPFNLNEQPKQQQQQTQLGGGLFNANQQNTNQNQPSNTFFNTLGFGQTNTNTNSLFGSNQNQNQNQSAFGGANSLFNNTSSTGANMFGFSQTPQSSSSGLAAFNPQGMSALQKPTQNMFAPQQNTQPGQTSFGSGNSTFGQNTLGGNQQNNSVFKSDLTKLQFGNNTLAQPQAQQQQNSNMFSNFIPQSNGLFQTSGQTQQNQFGNMNNNQTPQLNFNDNFLKPRK